MAEDESFLELGFDLVRVDDAAVGRLDLDADERFHLYLLLGLLL